MLGKEISIQEIEEAISSLANGKSPGIDGLQAKFYKVNKDWISSELFEVYQFAADNGSLGDKINQGLIKLLPKDGDKLQVKNWRPITLLNISYKVIAKLLANRIAKVLDSIISVTKTGFIKGRFILENLVTSWEAMHWAKADNQNSTMILLDFEKAYDRIEWHFVIAMLKQFGFPDYFFQ